MLQSSFFTWQRGKRILKGTIIVSAVIFAAVAIPEYKRNQRRNAYLEGVVLAKRQPDRDTISSHSKPIPEQ